MEIITKNIRFLREQADWTQRDLAAKLDINVSTLGAYEESRAIPPISRVIEIADLFNIDVDTLVRVDLAKPLKKGTPKFKKNKEVLTITVDSDNKENIELVSQKASAGYLNGLQDATYIKDLPKINLPSLTKNKTYRAFEIVGDSMLPVQPKSIIIAEYVDNLEDVKNGECCIIVTKDEGISYKRVYNFLKEANKLLLVSDNTLYEPYTLDYFNVLEIWRKRKIITDDIVSDREPINGNQIAALVLNIQEQVIKLKGK